MIDMDQFNARLGNNQAVIVQILKMFSEQFGKQPDLMRPSFTHGDTDTLFQLAHSLKGALGNMCAEEDAELAGQIESLARSGELPAESLMAEIELRLSEIEAQIQAELN